MSSNYRPLIYIISAPSGSGKSTLVNELLKLVPNLDFSISYTTRDIRGSEQNGKQYHFVSREVFEQMVRSGDFLEYANFDGNYYGTARRFLQEAGKKGRDLLLDIDVQGAAQIKQKLTDAVSIFVLPPDRKTLEWRLRKRSEDAEGRIENLAELVSAARESRSIPEMESDNDYIVVHIDRNDRITVNDTEVHNDRELLSNLKDETLSLEERLDHEQLAKCVRELMVHLPVQRDREVLERFYLHEEPRTEIRESLQLTEMQFNQVLWRARQRFGDILRRHGMAGGETASAQSTR